MITIGFGTALITSVLVPVLLLAHADDNSDIGGTPKDSCARLSTTLSATEQRIANRDSRLEAKRDDIASRIDAKQNKRDEKLTEKRARWDANRAEHFAKLDARAEGDEQKQAVAAFSQAITAAIAVRRAAIDGAIQDFRQGIQQAVISRKSSADEAVSTFRNSVKSAFEKANSDCDDGVDPKTVRENLRADLKATREKFASDRQEIEKLKSSMEVLIVVKREAVKKAIDDFKAAIEQARADFKDVFTQESPEE